jgi:hypothetical protein
VNFPGHKASPIPSFPFVGLHLHQRERERQRDRESMGGALFHDPSENHCARLMAVISAEVSDVCFNEYSQAHESFAI